MQKKQVHAVTNLQNITLIKELNSPHTHTHIPAHTSTSCTCTLPRMLAVYKYAPLGAHEPALSGMASLAEGTRRSHPGGGKGIIGFGLWPGLGILAREQGLELFVGSALHSYGLSFEHCRVGPV